MSRRDFSDEVKFEKFTSRGGKHRSVLRGDFKDEDRQHAKDISSKKKRFDRTKRRVSEDEETN